MRDPLQGSGRLGQHASRHAQGRDGNGQGQYDLEGMVYERFYL